MKENRALRVASYILLPILIGIIIISLIYTMAKDNYTRYLDVSYFETEEFSSRYMSYLSGKARNLIYSNNTNWVDGENRIIYDYSDYGVQLKDHYFIIIYENKIITNVVDMNSPEDIKKYIQDQEGEKLRIEKGVIKEGKLNRKY